MSKKITSLLLLAYFLTSTPILAKQFTAKDTKSFELAGVKLGMSEDQAVKGVTQKFNVSQSQLDFRKTLGPNLDDTLTGQKETKFIHLNTNKQDIYIYFETDISAKPYKRVVSAISYQLPNTPENNKNLYNSVVNLYGEQSTKSLGKYFWCQIKKFSCIENTPTMTVHDNTVYLVDESYVKAKYEYQQNKNNVKPNL